MRVDPKTDEVHVFPLPKGREGANLNTATFDRRGVLWFTGQRGIYGWLDPKVARMQVFDAPRGTGPYGIATAPDGKVYYASLAGSYIARVNLQTGAPTVLDPPTSHQGARRVWADSQSRIWVSEWNAGQVAMYDPGTDTGANGVCRVRTQGRMRSTWTTRTWCGSVTLERTRWSGLIRHWKRSKRFRSPVQARMCGSYLVELTRCGAPSRGRINWLWSEHSRLREESRG